MTKDKIKNDITREVVNKETIVAYVVRVTRKDGTWFYASLIDGPAELFNSREDAAEYREWLTENIDPEMLEVKEVGVLIYER